MKALFSGLLVVNDRNPTETSLGKIGYRWLTYLRGVRVWAEPKATAVLSEHFLSQLCFPLETLHEVRKLALSHFRPKACGALQLSPP